MACSVGITTCSCDHSWSWDFVYAILAKVWISCLIQECRISCIDRWLVNQGRDEDALTVLSSARNLPRDSDLVQIEFL